MDERYLMDIIELLKEIKDELVILNEKLDSKKTRKKVKGEK